MAEKSPYELWVEAGEDPERYRDLMHEAGLLLRPGDEGYDQAPRNLPCGWPHRPWPYDGPKGRARLTGSLDTGGSFTGDDDDAMTEEQS